MKKDEIDKINYNTSMVIDYSSFISGNDPVDATWEELQSIVNDMYKHHSVAVPLKPLLSQNQFNLVTDWFGNEKFRRKLHNYEIILLNSIVVHNIAPTADDRIILNRIREKWIQFLK